MMTINKLRTVLYRVARVLGDVAAVAHGHVTRRADHGPLAGTAHAVNDNRGGAE